MALKPQRKTSRLTFACSRDDEDILRAAAEETGTELSVFCREAAVKKARKVLKI